MFHGIKPKYEDCEGCNDGVCECNTCGCAHDCKVCDGNGRIDKTKEKYEEMLLKDKKMIEEYMRESAVYE